MRRRKDGLTTFQKAMKTTIFFGPAGTGAGGSGGRRLGIMATVGFGIGDGLGFGRRGSGLGIGFGTSCGSEKCLGIDGISFDSLCHDFHVLV